MSKTKQWVSYVVVVVVVVLVARRWSNDTGIERDSYGLDIALGWGLVWGAWKAITRLKVSLSMQPDLVSFSRGREGDGKESRSEWRRKCGRKKRNLVSTDTHTQCRRCANCRLGPAHRIWSVSLTKSCVKDHNRTAFSAIDAERTKERTIGCSKQIKLSTLSTNLLIKWSTCRQLLHHNRMMAATRCLYNRCAEVNNFREFTPISESQICQLDRPASLVAMINSDLLYRWWYCMRTEKNHDRVAKESAHSNVSSAISI